MDVNDGVPVGKGKKKVYKPIPLDVSVHLRYLHQDLGLTGAALSRRYPNYSRASIFRHINKRVGDDTEDKRKQNRGRPPVLSARDKRRVINQVPILRKGKGGKFTIKDIRDGSAVRSDISDMTVRRVLHNAGYGFLTSPRKGILSAKDAQTRLKFAKNAKRKFERDIWINDICFYLDGTGFVHKTNPRNNALGNAARTWRRKGERLNLNCTASGRHEGVGGKVAKFMVAITYGQGVTMCEEYEERLTGEFFGKFVRKHFPQCFAKSGKQNSRLFLQDGDPSQNSGIAKQAFIDVNGTKFSIPPRSPDLNPIENIFHIIKRKLQSDAIEQNITYESYWDFKERIKQTFSAISPKLIDKTIASMSTRIDLVIASKGQCIKY